MGASGTPHWHALTPDEVRSRLETGPGGLSSSDAARRLAVEGPNRLEIARPVPWWRILARQFAGAVVLLLAAAAVVAGVVGDVAEAVAIAAVLALNASLGFVVELRARRAMDALLRYDVPDARVVRDGEKQGIPAHELVPGDLVELEAGDAVPADARLVESRGLRAVEAALTGESVPVDKSSTAVEAAAPLPDRRSMLYMGTTAAAGAGQAIVVATGPRTRLGEVGRLLATVEPGRSPLERRLDALGHRLIGMTLLIAAVVVLLGVLRGAPWARMLETGLALAVAAVPEGLPAVATIALAVGLARMARRNALVRRLSAVEALGSTTVVCSDKTGTLTAGQMNVRRVVGLDYEVAVEGRGYEPTGSLQVDGRPEPEPRHPGFARLLEAAALTPTAAFDPETGAVVGDPTDAALGVLAARAGVTPETARGDGAAVEVLPFSGERLMSAAAGEGATWVKGAPHAVRAACTRVAGADGDMELADTHRRTLTDQEDALAREGFRVIALAWAPRRCAALDDVSDLVFLGHAALMDPPADEVAPTVARLRGAGIRTVMITGDHRATAEAVARELGMVEGDTAVVDGAELARTPDADLPGLVARAGVYARTSPEDKLRIVTALQARGEVVAMLGDGVNDAAALRKADVGVAMGLRGTDLARETAAIVLQDDRFATVAAAVEEGRAIDDNIRKFAWYLFSCNLAEILVLLGAGVVGLPLPLLPLQILWLNLVTDTFPALALALEPAEPGLMARRPRAPGAPLLSRAFVGSLSFYALTITAVTLGAWLWGLHGDDPAKAGTLAFTTLALAQLFHLGNARGRRPMVAPRDALANPWALAAVALVLGLQFAAVTWPPLQAVLDTRTPSPREWGLCLGLSLVPALVGQALEWTQARRAPGS